MQQPDAKTDGNLPNTQPDAKTDRNLPNDQPDAKTDGNLPNARPDAKTDESLSNARPHANSDDQLSNARPDTKSDEKFRKSDRILKRETFRRAYDGGKKYQAKYFTAFVISNQQDSSRLGITVTRKVAKSAKRNRSRRLVREVYRKNKWRVPPGIDIVINVKGALISAGYDELEGDFVQFLERAK